MKILLYTKETEIRWTKNEKLTLLVGYYTPKDADILYCRWTWIYRLSAV